MLQSLDNEQVRRLWEYRLHINSNYYNRLNFFLVFESVLLGVVGVLYSKPGSAALLVKMIILLGLSLTVIWGYAQGRIKYLLDYIDEQVAKVAPEFKVTQEERKRSRWFISSKWLLTYIIPILVALVWFVLLFIV